MLTSSNSTGTVSNPPQLLSPESASEQPELTTDGALEESAEEAALILGRIDVSDEPRDLAEAIINTKRKMTVQMPISSEEKGDLNIRLFKACELGDESEVISLINAGADVNAQNTNELTPLMIILDSITIEEEIKLSIINSLIHKGANVNHKNKKGYTPLFFACRNPLTTPISAFKILLNDETNVQEVMGDFGDTSIIALMKHGENRPSVVDLFIKKGIDIDHKNKYGFTLLMLHLDRSDGVSEELVKYFIDRGANINHTCSHMTNALFFACQTSNFSKNIIEMLINDETDVNQQVSWGSTAAFALVENNLEDEMDDNKQADFIYVLKLLIAKGLNLNCQNNLGYSLLTKYCKYEYISPELIKCLIKAGANVNHRDIDGYSALHNLCSRSRENTTESENCIIELVKHGAALDVKNGFGQTPLILACDRAPDLVPILLFYKAKKPQDFESVGLFGNILESAEQIRKKEVIKEAKKLLSHKTYVGHFMKK